MASSPMTRRTSVTSSSARSRRTLSSGAGPRGGIRLADDHDVDRHGEPSNLSTQPHHLGMTIGHLTLDHEEVEVAVRAGVATGMGAEEHDARGRSGCCREPGPGKLDHFAWDHVDPKGTGTVGNHRDPDATSCQSQATSVAAPARSRTRRAFDEARAQVEVEEAR